MRFGLMFILPDVTVGASGTTPMSSLNTPSAKSPDDVDKNKKLSQSVFASLDNNKNNEVNYNEASSIFTNAKKSLEGTAAETALDNAVGNANAKVQIKNGVFAKFNADDSFKNLVSKFSSKYTAQVAEGADQSSLTQSANTLRSQIDGKVKSDAQALATQANNQLAEMYKDAMLTAINDYNNGKDLGGNSAESLNNSNRAATGSTDGNVGDIQDKENNGDIKFETKAFSKYDTNPNGSVRASEGEVTLKSLDNIIGDKLSNLGTPSALSNALKTDLFTAYNEAKNSYSIDIGSKDISAKSEVELTRKQNEAIAKLDKKVESKKAGADKKLEKAVNRAYENAYKTNLANADKLGDKLMLIQTKDGDNSIDLVPSGNQYTALFNGKPAKFTPQEGSQNSGTLVANYSKNGTNMRTTVTITDGKVTASCTDTVENQNALVNDNLDGIVTSGEEGDTPVNITSDEITHSSNVSNWQNNGNRIAPEGASGRDILAAKILDSLDTIITTAASEGTESADEPSEDIKGYMKKGLSKELATFVANPDNKAKPAGFKNGKIVMIEIDKGNDGGKVKMSVKDLEAYIKNKKAPNA